MGDDSERTTKRTLLRFEAHRAAALAWAVVKFFAVYLVIGAVGLMLLTIGIPDSGPPGTYRYTYVVGLMVMVVILAILARWMIWRPAREFARMKAHLERKRTREVYEEKYEDKF